MRENRSSVLLTRSDTYQSMQLQRARCLKFRIQEEEELYYLCSKNKGADQVCTYCTADLRLCFLIGKILVFSWHGSYMKSTYNISHNKTFVFHSCVTWSAYHKNVLASADYGGIVSLWDASTGQRFKHFEVSKGLK